MYDVRFDELAETVTEMTRLEELLLSYAFSWGRSNVRIKKYEGEYDCNNKTLMKAIQYRLRRELNCRVRWPMYASYEEVSALRAPSWNQHFDP